MPIYEYTCAECHHHFEAIVRIGETPGCPKCDAPNPKKEWSVFAVGKSGAQEFAPAPCGTCGDPRGPGACQLDD